MMKKDTPHTNPFDRVYSGIFVVLTLVLLFSFAASSGFSLSSISTSFRWRSTLIDIYTFARMEAGDRVFNNAVIGKDGWIFYTGEPSIPDYQNTAALKPGRLARLQQNLDSLSKDLEEMGITLLVIIPPNKSTIYAQNMPEQIPVIGDQSRLDHFLDYMKKNGNTPILDLRPVLLEASRSQVVYHKTDTHWNAIGAYYGYVATMSALVPDYPMLAPHPISDYTYTYTGDSVYDLPQLMGLQNYTEENWVLLPNFEVQLQEKKRTLDDGRLIRTVTNINGQQLPKLLVFGDSFYGSLAYFIEPHFSSVKSIPFTAIDNIWSLDWIQQENPDIVLIEIVERSIDSTLPLLFDR